MVSKRSLFLKHIAQTSDSPSIVDVVSANGIHITDRSGKTYVDLSCGIGPNIIGHRHPVVQNAIAKQSSEYLHTMVYGEHVQSPQVDFAKALLNSLPTSFEQVYFLSSGSEAVEAAIKIARVHTGRFEVLSARNAYHGSTLGAESLRSDIEFTSQIAPLVPGIDHIDFNVLSTLEKITAKTAAVIMETVQAENGVLVPSAAYMKALRLRCNEVGALLIFDEIQVGLGRTGRLFAFEHLDIVPDILVLGKALGGGLPLSGVLCSTDIMQGISKKLPLGHLTTFGGHPLCCATGLAVFDYIIENQLWLRAEEIGQRFETKLHTGPWQIRRIGAMIGFEVDSEEVAVSWHNRLHEIGIISDLLLFDLNVWRLSPPLIMSDKDIDEVCERILSL